MNTQSEQLKLSFNFESVFTILYNNVDFEIIQNELMEIPILQDLKVSQTSLFVLLFLSYFEKSEKNIDPGNINRQIHGERGLSRLKRFYQVGDNLDAFAYDFSEYFLDAITSNIYTAIEQILQLYLNSKRICEIHDNPIFIESKRINYDKAKTFNFTQEEQLDIAIFFTKAIYRSFSEPILSDSKMPPLDVFPSPCEPFLGRKDELQKLSEIFKTNCSVKCFLSGYSGLGKSELAKKFAQRYKTNNKKSTLIYISYENNFRSSIANLSFSDDLSHLSEDERFEMHVKYLRSLSSKDLLVIDNFNVAPTDDTYFDTIMKFKCKILFTSTYNYEEACTLKLEEIKEKETLLKLIETYYKKANRFKDTILEIIDELNGHTFSIVLASKLMKVKRMDPPELLELLRSKSQLFDTLEEFNIEKDGKNQKSTYAQHILRRCEIFSVNSDLL